MLLHSREKPDVVCPSLLSSHGSVMWYRCRQWDNMQPQFEIEHEQAGSPTIHFLVMEGLRYLMLGETRQSLWCLVLGISHSRYGVQSSHSSSLVSLELSLTLVLLDILWPTWEPLLNHFLALAGCTTPEQILGHVFLIFPALKLMLSQFCLNHIVRKRGRMMPWKELRLVVQEGEVMLSMQW